MVPVVGCIAVANERFNFISGQFTVMNTIFFLPVAQIIFIFAFWEIFIFNKMIAERINRAFVDMVHAHELIKRKVK